MQLEKCLHKNYLEYFFLMEKILYIESPTKRIQYSYFRLFGLHEEQKHNLSQKLLQYIYYFPRGRTCECWVFPEQNASFANMKLGRIF